MSGPRSAAVAAPLPNGEVLIAGGLSGANHYLSSAELFDPRTRRFSSAGLGKMTTARTGAVAAQLPNGDVLIAGGATNRVALSSAELFDPKTKRFSSAGVGRMTTPRAGAVAAPLPNGKVLIAGGNTTSGATLASAELFDPKTKRFSSAGVGRMTVARYGAVAAPLPNGKVLIAGGESSTVTFLASAELFDPTTKRFSSAGIGSMSVGLSRAVAAPLPDGKILIAGGAIDLPIAHYTSNAQVFDPNSDTFSSADVGSMTVPRADAAAARLLNGQVLIAGGLDRVLSWLSNAEEAR